MTANVFERIREACARVARRAQSVRLDPARVEALGRELARAVSGPILDDPAHRSFREPETTLAFVLTLDAINFGSGWFPLLQKRPGMSGYFSIATALEEHFAARGAWRADELASLTTRDCARCFGQERAASEVGELMSLYAQALNDLGRFLSVDYGGRFSGPVEEAGGSAARLVECLASMPLFRDVARYGEFDVPFYKRAQITVADLANAFGGRGPGRFEDLDALTLFADNLVPHVLRCEGVLHYAPSLERRIERGELLPSGCPEEIEIRALAVHAVEGCVEAARRAGGETSAHRIDALLWHRGQRPEYKALPRHRTRCTYY
ncbi:MAG: queuosine salvage family protein [Myxococcales bacterium]|nr:queuosine salvage family protein [Myxococcales bacterium]MDH5307024.1 queuosine salvage family protein [Myxococcales bacterium]MDH5567176.1 queuosine salvage family protein [Myxococcales bacterium]